MVKYYKIIALGITVANITACGYSIAEDAVKESTEEVIKYEVYEMDSSVDVKPVTTSFIKDLMQEYNMTNGDREYDIDYENIEIKFNANGDIIEACNKFGNLINRDSKDTINMELYTRYASDVEYNTEIRINFYGNNSQIVPEILSYCLGDEHYRELEKFIYREDYSSKDGVTGYNLKYENAIINISGGIEKSSAVVASCDITIKSNINIINEENIITYDNLAKYEKLLLFEESKNMGGYSVKCRFNRDDFWYKYKPEEYIKDNCSIKKAWIKESEESDIYMEYYISKSVCYSSDNDKLKTEMKLYGFDRFSMQKDLVMSFACTNPEKAKEEINKTINLDVGILHTESIQDGRLNISNKEYISTSEENIPEEYKICYYYSIVR